MKAGFCSATRMEITMTISVINLQEDRKSTFSAVEVPDQ